MPKGEIYHITKEDRIHFKKGFQRKLLELTPDKFNYTLGELSDKVFHVTKRMVLKYMDESSRLSITQVKTLSEVTGLRLTYILENWVSKVIPKENILQEQGKSGSKYKRKNSTPQKKKHNREELIEIRKLNLLKIDLLKACRSSLINQKPTVQEKEIINENLANNFEFDFQKNLETINEWRCFDFVYYLNSEPVLAEEVTNANYHKKSQTLDFIERNKWLKNEFGIPLVVTFKNMPKRLDMVLLLLEEGIVPILDSKNRMLLIEACINDSTNIQNYLENLKDSIKKSIEENLKIAFTAAKRESLAVKNNLEKDIHDKLSELGLNPFGKKILQTIYGTYLIPDNYFVVNGQKFCVLTSIANSHNHYEYYLRNMRHIHI